MSRQVHLPISKVLITVSISFSITTLDSSNNLVRISSEYICFPLAVGFKSYLIACITCHKEWSYLVYETKPSTHIRNILRDFKGGDAFKYLRYRLDRVLPNGEPRKLNYILGKLEFSRVEYNPVS